MCLWLWRKKCLGHELTKNDITTFKGNSFMISVRSAVVERNTKETKISVQLSIPEEGKDANCEVSTGIGFLDHMLEAFSRHGAFNISLKCDGDLHIDQHHTVEDVGIALGQAFVQILGDCKGIERFGMMECPLDEALVKAVIDISGRPYLHYGLKYQRPFIGALDSSLLKEFFGGFVLHAKWTLHLDLIRGDNDHHIAEAAFKAFARAAKKAVSLSGSPSIPSTKGVL
jgi:imidazoleglycerol-phosphate dehydratase